MVQGVHIVSEMSVICCRSCQNSIQTVTLCLKRLRTCADPEGGGGGTGGPDTPLEFENFT